VLRARSLTALAITLGLLSGASFASAQTPGVIPEMTFFPEVPVRGPLVLFPTFTLSEEFTDNVFLNNARKESDFITGFTPGVRVTLERATYRWAAGYNFTAEKYAKRSELDNVFQRQIFFVNGTQRLDPRLTLTLSDVFIENNNTNLVNQEGFSVGRRVSRSNSLNPGVVWDFAPQTSLRANLSYVLQRFDGQGAASSNIYRLTGDVLHNFSPRWSGSLGYEAAYIDVEGQPATTTHTPRVGGIYHFTPTRTASVTAGPTFLESQGSWTVSPFVNAVLSEEFMWGAASVSFSRIVGTAGGLGGTTENTSIGGVVQVNTLVRDLRVELAPRYSLAQSTGNRTGGNDINVHAFTLGLRASYQFTPWLAAVAGYRFFQQRSDTASTVVASGIDQNRLFFGLQFGAPIKFD
jgi:hypothetical protein